MKDEIPYVLTARHLGEWRWKKFTASSDAEAIDRSNEIIVERIADPDPGVARLWIDGSIILTAPGNRAIKQMPLRQPQLRQLNTAAMASTIGRSARYVREHAEDLGGVRHGEDGWLFDELTAILREGSIQPLPSPRSF